MTFQMRKVQPAGVKSVLYLAEMFPGVVLNRPAVVKVIVGKCYYIQRMGKDCWFSSTLSLPTSQWVQGWWEHTLGANQPRAAVSLDIHYGITVPYWEHRAPSLLHRTRKACWVWNPEDSTMAVPGRFSWVVFKRSTTVIYKPTAAAWASSTRDTRVCKDCLSTTTRSRFSGDIYLDFKGLDRVQASGCNTWRMHQLLPPFTEWGVFGELMR